MSSRQGSKAKPVKPGKKEDKKPKKSPELIFAEKVRYHKDLDSRWAILQEARVEFFRGKDFSSLIRRHPQLGEGLIPKEEAAKLHQPLEQALLEIMLVAGLVVRCDRVVKTVRPGKKKLSKWPARLEIHPVQAFATEEGFYSWTFERQQPMWQTVLTILFPVFTVACCLFPVFPYWAKLSVLYFLLTLIAAIFLLLFVRLSVFAVVWIFTGKRVWFFPRILEEEGSLAELFRFWPDKDEDPPSKLTTRAAVALVLVFTFWLMVKYAPDENTRARYQRRVTNIIDDFVQWTPQMLAGNTTVESNDTASNETAPGNLTSNGTQASFNSSGTETFGDVTDPVSEDADAEVRADRESGTEGSAEETSEGGKDEL